MKRHDAIQIGDLIRQAIREAGAQNSYDAHRICYLWPEAVGPTINRYTSARWVKNDELHVRITSGPIKNELAFMSDAIVQRLNELAGASQSPIIRRLFIH
ncbi:MAG: DUF721 domain-containing protein [Muribaculaceae bacterium]|nr:DUF721 domain-containing protein [Muribaculaceae bacterium]